MSVLSESNGRQKERRSERAIPFVSGEEMVLISTRSGDSIVGKILDLSENGAFVYLSEESDILDVMETPCRLTLYHQGEVFDVESKVARKSRRLIGFEFINPPAAMVNRIRIKIVQMADWMRVKGQKPQ